MSAAAKEIGVGVVGLGFMGRTHVTAFDGAAAAGLANRLVAVSDMNPALASGEPSASGNLETGEHAERLFDPARTSFHLDPAELFTLGEVDLVSICTHTSSHVELAIQALEAGKHVLLEKPVALVPSEVERLVAAARTSDRICMPAMCVRYWPGWDWLRGVIQAGTFGAVRGAVFRRLTARPGWSAEFYADTSHCGGALFDLHVHDADFVRWCFGAPSALVSAGDADHLTTLYRYESGPSNVVAEGGWDLAGGFPFEMNFTVTFEEATADYRLGREHVLTLYRGDDPEPVEISDLNGYDGEVRDLLMAIGRGDRETVATLDEAVALTRMLEAEGESLRTGQTMVSSGTPAVESWCPAQERSSGT